MKRTRQPHTAPLALPALRLEGGLLLPGVLEQAAQGRASKQALADYGIPKGLTINDECSRAFQIACALWHDFAAHMQRADAALDATPRTTRFIHELLRDAFGYTTLQPATTCEAGELRYPVTFLAGALPVLVAPHTLGLDGAHPSFAPQGGGSRKKTAFQSLQDLLNASPAYLWGIVSNGRQLRLLRDAASLTRPSYLEIDLEALLSEQHWADFKSLWLILHASRAPLGSDGDDCIWEHWRTQGQNEGARVREGLRHNVENALATLGEGFIAHPANDALREALHSGTLTPQHYYQQLLRLIYRFIFLITVEERNLLHPPESTPAARAAYSQGYALARLRPLCLRRRLHTRHSDQWDAIRIIFAGLEAGQPRLALPALGGLFDPDQCPDLDAAQLANAHLLSAMQHLRWARPDPKAGLLRIDWRNMDSEEMGSVYESLLELTPTVDLTAGTFRFAAAAGNARKLTGSYYTPSSLVDQLIRSALDPVIEQRLAAAPTPAAGAAALLSIRVIDPACGSGHFLLAAARRLAEKLATLQSLESGAEGSFTQEGWRTALRAVTAHCIYGVDRNPLAIELARMSLWLEAHDASRPLSFLDHHLQVGDALLGLASLDSLAYGIPKEAYKPLTGDDKAACKTLTKDNAAALKQLAKEKNSRQLVLFRSASDILAALRILESEAGDTPQSIKKQRRAWETLQAGATTSPIATAADLATSAWLLPKTAGSPCPTTATLLRLIDGSPTDSDKAAIAAARTACRAARVLHWPLAFPQIFLANGETVNRSPGFDCVLGNPPWERIKLQEEEFFAARSPDVANARNKAERAQRIRWLAEGQLAANLHPELAGTQPSEAEQRLHRDFLAARRAAEATSAFVHAPADGGGRYPLTGTGDVNTYALFAETILAITSPAGRAGFIVPTNIATDDSTKRYFGHLTQHHRLVSLYDIENREKLFSAVDSRMKYCLLTLGAAQQAQFIFFAHQPGQLADQRRRFTLSAEDFRLINPNTRTCPVFRSGMDAELTKKLYRAAPVLWQDKTDTQEERNPWGISFMAMFHMSGDSALFKNEPAPDRLPLYEAKLIHQFDHRWATYDSGDTRDATDDEKRDPAFTPRPRYWVEKTDVLARLANLPHTPKWLMGWRDITNATNERTVIASVIPLAAVNHKTPLLFTNSTSSIAHPALLLANFNCLTLDYVARQKLGGTDLTYTYLKQFPVLPPNRYTRADLDFIVPRVLELTYTAHDMRPWAEDVWQSWQSLLVNGESLMANGKSAASAVPPSPTTIHHLPENPYPFDPERRAILRAELDAYYAHLYGLTEDELRYILDPANVMGADWPSETFRVLREKEIRQYGEYRTQRLVLEAWRRLHDGAAHA